MVSITRAAASEAANPMAIPIPAIASPLPTTSRNTCARLAPSAMRIPISPVRCVIR